MKVEIKGRKIIVELTEKQLRTIFAALDSCGFAEEHSGNGIYADVPRLERKLIKLYLDAKSNKRTNK